MRQLIVGPNDSGQRIDKFMGKRFRNMPSALIYKFIRKKCVSVNRKKVKENYILQEGDVLSFFISDEFFGEPTKTEPFRTLTPELTIAYEDGINFDRRKCIMLRRIDLHFPTRNQYKPKKCTQIQIVFPHG